MKLILFSMKKTNLSGDREGYIWPHLCERFLCGRELRLFCALPKAQIKTNWWKLKDGRFEHYQEVLQ